MSQQVIGSSQEAQGYLVVFFKPDAKVYNTAEGLRAPSTDVSGVQEILDKHHAKLELLFGPSEARVRSQVESVTGRGRGEAPGQDNPPADMPHVEVPDLGSYYEVHAPSDRLQQLAKDLNAHELVDGAYLKPSGLPPRLSHGERTIPPDAPATTPNFIDRQTYLRQAPGGIDAIWAWVLPGGGGDGVRVTDCEWGWRFTHEDLLENKMGVIAGSSYPGSDERVSHGTAVLGVICGDRNTFGVTGIVPEATVSGSSVSGSPSATAIKFAADRLQPGDILLIEIHRGRDATRPEVDPIAIEWWPDDFAAIRYAVAKGVIVVEAAGNGAQNLDDPSFDVSPGFPKSWKNPFNPQNPSSGAILVGAGAPPSGTHGKDHGPDRSRLGFSNYGRRVDVQGWGEEVTTTGYGDLQGGVNQDVWYTDVFAGTSSASPIVTGALASVQGILRKRGRRSLTPDEARVLLRKTGAPQQPGPSAPTSQRIGKRPNLRSLIAYAARFPSRSADLDGDGRAETFATFSHGIAVLKQDGKSFRAVVAQQTGDALGRWKLDVAKNVFGPAADYDGSRAAQMFVRSATHIGLLKLSSSSASSATAAATATSSTQLLKASVVAETDSELGEWHLSAAFDSFGPVADFDGDGKAELLVTSAWGLGLLKQDGASFKSALMARNRTRFTLAGGGGWILNTATDELGPVGNFASSGSSGGGGKGAQMLVINHAWGIGVLQLDDKGKDKDKDRAKFQALLTAASGTRVTGYGKVWVIDAALDRYGPVGDFDGDGRDEIFVTHPWGIGVLKLQQGGGGGAGSYQLLTLATQKDGERLADATYEGDDPKNHGWRLDTANDHFGPAGRFGGGGADRDYVLVTSEWGVALLRLNVRTIETVLLKENGTVFPMAGSTSTSSSGSGSDKKGGDNKDKGAGGGGDKDKEDKKGQQGSAKKDDGWRLNTALDELGTAARFAGGGRDAPADILVSSDWGIGVLRLAGDTFETTALRPNDGGGGGSKPGAGGKFVLNTHGADFGHGY